VAMTVRERITLLERRVALIMAPESVREAV
jgi:hypothetical protein